MAEGGVLSLFAVSRTSFIPKSSTVVDQVRIVRSPDALRPLKLCSCDWKLITKAVCSGLQQHSVGCIQPAQRCVSTRQMTDNIFEIETPHLHASRLWHLMDGFRVCLPER